MRPEVVYHTLLAINHPNLLANNTHWFPPIITPTSHLPCLSSLCVPHIICCGKQEALSVWKYYLESFSKLLASL